MAEAPERYCGNCGHELSSQDRFCTNCGKPVHRTAHVPTPEADVPVTPPLHSGDSSGAAVAEQTTEEAEERASKLLAWRYFVLVTLLAAFGSFLYLQFITYFLKSLPFFVDLDYSTRALVALVLLYVANAPFGLVVGYLRPSSLLRNQVLLGLAVGLAQMLGDKAFFAYHLNATLFLRSPQIVVMYGVTPALIFATAAMLGSLTKKGRFSLNAVVLSSAIGLVSAIVGLITALQA